MILKSHWNALLNQEKFYLFPIVGGMQHLTWTMLFLYQHSWDNKKSAILKTITYDKTKKYKINAKKLNSGIFSNKTTSLVKKNCIEKCYIIREKYKINNEHYL